jgi:hypothetical protein
VIRQIVEFVNAKLEKEQLKSSNYNEVRLLMKNELKYRWKKADPRPPRAFTNRLELARIVFKEFLQLLRAFHFTIVYVDE